MDRRESFASCVTDSEGDGDSTGGSYSDLSIRDISDKGDRVHSTRSPDSVTSSLQSLVRPSTPQSKNPFQRRSVAKRQAPQPPVRPPATTTPSPVTTVHLQFEPVMTPPVTNMPSEQTGKITKIVSEPVMLGHLIPPSNVDQVKNRPRPVVVQPSAFSPDRPLSPPLQKVPTQCVGGFQIVENNMPHPHHALRGQPVFATQALSPSDAKSPPPVIPTTVPMLEEQMTSGSRPMSPPPTQSRSFKNYIPYNEVSIPQREEFVRPTSPLTQPINVARNTSHRSVPLQHSPRTLSNLKIRLIDEESDSEAYQSDATEELSTPVLEYPATYLHYFDPDDPLIAQHSVVPVHKRDVMLAHAEYYDYYSSFDESPSHSEVGTVLRQSAEVLRGRAKRLVHSASDPGVGGRPQRLLHLHDSQQHPRAPGVASPSSLDQLSEEDDEIGESEAEEQRLEDEIVGPGLKRTDSMVTVAHLYEDVLVSSRLRVRVTLTNLTVVVVVAALVLPNTAIMLYTAFRLVFGTLFPAYYSYKAVKTKNVKEYVKWMMYWIVFAFFTCFETFTDLFLSFWFPFYYELKILVVLWLLSPATRGSSILYRKFVHPWLTRREDDIDNCIAQAKQQGYSTVIQLGTKGVNYATTVLMQTAIKGGGGLVNQLRRSYSSGELSDGDMNRNVKALPNIPDDGNHSSGSVSYEAEARVRADSDAAYKSRGPPVNRGVRSNKTRSADVTDYYQDLSDDPAHRRRSPRTQENGSLILSADDLTSGYSSGDPDAGDLIYDLRHDPNPNHYLETIPEPKKSSKVRRTQSCSASTLNNHRSLRVVTRRGEGKEGARSGSAGRGSGPVDDMGAPASYSSSGQPPAHHHGSSFKRSKPGEISAYATLPRTTNKRAAATKKRQV